MKILLGVLLLCFVSSFTAKSFFSFGDILREATASFNQKSKETNVFRPPIENALRSLAMSESADGATLLQSINFTLSETVCLKSEDYGRKECTYKENGAMKKCFSKASVLFSHPSEAASLTVSCEDVVDPEERKALTGPPRPEDSSWWHIN